MSLEAQTHNSRRPARPRAADEIIASGLPLEAAFQKFARARRLREDRLALASVMAPIRTDSETPPEVIQGLSVIRDTIFRHDEITRNRWDRFRAKLVSGNLVAAGQLAGETAARLIPQRLWESGEIDLSLSRLTAVDAVYEGVRVMRAAK